MVQKYMLIFNSPNESAFLNTETTASERENGFCCDDCVPGTNRAGGMCVFLPWRGSHFKIFE